MKSASGGALLLLMTCAIGHASSLRPEASPAPAPRVLCLHQARCEAAPGFADPRAFAVTARAVATGLRQERLVVRVRARTLDGRAIGPTPLAPPAWVDERGLTIVATDDVRFDASTWEPFRVDVPGGVLDLDPGAPVPLVVSMLARCGGLTSLAETEMVYPAGSPASMPLRSVRVLEVTQSTGLFVTPLPYNLDAAPAAGVRPVPVSSAVQVRGRVEADGLRGETMVLTMRLRRIDGRPVAAARDGPPGFADERGLFRSIARDPIRFDQASWADLTAPIPLPALALAPGRSHRLILTYHVGAGSFSAWSEQEITLAMPGAASVLPEPLLEALARGDEDAALPLLEGVPGDARDAGGRTALHLAAAHGLRALVGLLIARGAPLDATDQRGRTPLHLAALRGHEPVVSLLLEKGAEPGVRDEHGDRPVELAGSDSVAGRLRDAEERKLAGAAARRCADAFLRAAQRGDRAALASWLDARALARVPPFVRPFEFAITGVEPGTGGVQVSARIQVPGGTPLGSDFRVSIGLARAGETWTVTSLQVEPQLRD